MVFVITVAGILVVSLFFNAPLEEPVNVMHPPNPAKAPWYFLGLQEMVSYSAFWGGVGIPTLEVLILLLVPYIDRKTAGVGKWFAKERLLANSLFMTFVVVNVILMIIGTSSAEPTGSSFRHGDRLGDGNDEENLVSTRLSLAVASFVVLIVHGIVFYDQFFNNWEKHQTAYFEQARSLAKTDAERQSIDAHKPRIEQIIVTQFGDSRVDRCTTCHIASDDPRFQNHAQPLRTHSYSAALGDVQRDGKWERRHKFSDFGCTICHDGQGRGLETFYAHGEDEYWPDPMLGFIVQANWQSELKPKLTGKEYMQSDCAQCHTEENFAGTPLVKRGRQLFFEKACYGCHRIEGLSNGTLGPDLTEVGKRWRINYLWGHTLNPRAYSAASFMPKFDLSDDEIKALVVFLKSRRGMNFSETSLGVYRARLQQTQMKVSADEKAGTANAPVRRTRRAIDRRALLHRLPQTRRTAMATFRRTCHSKA